MKKEWKFIGFDLGAESGRCIVAILKDKIIELKQVHRFTTYNIKTDSGLQWDVNSIFQEIITGLSKAKEEFGADFQGIGIDTWGVDYVLINAEGKPLGNAFHYRDDRTDGMPEEVFKILAKESVFEMSGNQPAQYNTLFQLLAEKKRITGFPTEAEAMLLMPDYFNYLLSGNKRSEYTIASTTNLTNPVTRNWSKQIIKAFGLPENLFTEMAEPGTILGELLPWICSETGLNNDIPVISTAGHDTASAVAAIPFKNNNSAFLSSGTWSLMGVELKVPVLSNKALQYKFTNEGGVDKTTRFLKNIIGLWPLQECRKSWQNMGEIYDYSELAQYAKTAGFVKAWVDLTDPRFLKPGEMPQKICSFLEETNQLYKTEAGFITAVILESLAYAYRETITEIENITAKRIDRLHIVGGGIQNELLTQYTADAVGKTVIAGPVEGAILGNIGIQAIAAGAVPNINTWREIIENSFELKKYTPINTEYYIQNEQNYKKILKTN